MAITPDELAAVKDHLSSMGEDVFHVNAINAVSRLIAHGKKMKNRYDAAKAVMSLAGDADADVVQPDLLAEARRVLHIRVSAAAPLARTEQQAGAPRMNPFARAAATPALAADFDADAVQPDLLAEARRVLHIREPAALSLNCVYAEGERPLHIAAWWNAPEAAELCIARHANVDAADDWQETPLHIAIMRGNFTVAKLLIAHQANLRAIDRLGRNVLHVAAQANNLELVQLFVDKGIDVNSRDRNGYTALHGAAQAMNGERAAAFLIAKGAKVDAESDTGSTALHEAAFVGSAKVVRLLISKGAPVDKPDDDHATPLHLAAKRGDVGVVQALLDGGADLRARDASGRTPRDLAELHKHSEVIKLLKDVENRSPATKPVAG